MIKFTKDLETVIWIMVIPYLLVDSINGFLVTSLNVDIKLSILYKGTILLLALIYIFKCNRKISIGLLALMFFLFLSPFFLAIEGRYLITTHDIPLAIKYLMLTVFIFFCDISSHKNLQRFIKNTELCLNVSFYFVIITVYLGYFGLGYNTYPTTGLGFKGFFQAGNELSAVFILLTSVKLFKVWTDKKLFTYLLYSLVVIGCGVSIATKSALIGALLIPILIPIASERENMFRFTYLKLWYLSFFTIIIALLGVYLVADYSQFGVLKRAIYFFEKDGLLGVIFSGREEFLKVYIDYLSTDATIASILFGSGHAVLLDAVGRTYIEIDPFDVAMYFGLPLAVLFSLTAFVSVLYPFWKLSNSFYSPALLVANSLLLFFAFFAGHVWTSGLLSLSWAASNFLMKGKFTHDGIKYMQPKESN
ncbi:O-antigen ligase family protein [Colwellia sp. C1TZA3]|uniref:O-antigen ligase family protein n=1 Tax=Colwellia sp. C1TZA3 TaxID=2508879 RepID=UPI0011B98443|nr:O-antigen ligase family protein [Colwellia sp. C1TZA3]TWX67497.1 hypothetical protein ESZ39_13220 [Colwellia sp. C1TZA3]